MTDNAEYKALEREVIKRLRDYASGDNPHFGQQDAWFIFGVLTRTLRVELDAQALKTRIEELAAEAGVRLEAH